MRCTMSWTDTLKAAALAVQAERTATSARHLADASCRWNAYDVWLSRARPLRDLTPRPAHGEQPTPPPQGTAPRD